MKLKFLAQQAWKARWFTQILDDGRKIYILFYIMAFLVQMIHLHYLYSFIYCTAKTTACDWLTILQLIE